MSSNQDANKSQRFTQRGAGSCFSTLGIIDTALLNSAVFPIGMILKNVDNEHRYQTNEGITERHDNEFQRVQARRSCISPNAESLGEISLLISKIEIDPPKHVSYSANGLCS